MTSQKAPPEPPARKAARDYIERGWRPIPLPEGSKNPNRRGWEQERWGVEDVPKVWSNGQGVGLLLGEPSGGLVDVDCDCPEAVMLARRFLPPTLTSGRETNPSSHWWYIAKGAKTAKFQEPSVGGRSEMLIELRSTGGQTVVEPSVHPMDGDRYLWSRGGHEVADVEAEDLIARVRKLAAACAVARKLPKGGRHDFALALAGFLLRNGLGEGDTLDILTGAWSVHDPPEKALRELKGSVRDTAAKIAADEPTTGGKTLEELCPGLPHQLSRYLGRPRPDNAERYRRAASPTTGRFTLSDVGNAERFRNRHGERVRWCPQRGRAEDAFLIFDGRRWVQGKKAEVIKLAHETARSIYEEAANEPDSAKQRELAKFALASQNGAKISGMLSQVRPYLAVGAEELDADPWLVNCQNGTLDLRTGELRPHDPDDLITKIVPVEYDPVAECPLWERTLEEILAEREVVEFVQRFAGYSISGSVEERCFAILHGDGRNGKSTLVEIMAEALGDYSKPTSPETILTKKYEGVGNDVAALAGARFVFTSETEQGRALAEAKIKQLTGSDTVTARFLFCEEFDFKPEFKLWLSTNNIPTVSGTDDGIWDRIRLIPFEQRFDGENENKKLKSQLRKELAGIFAWMVQGCAAWRREGLREPETVKKAVSAYRDEMDPLTDFVEARCVVRPDVSVLFAELYDSYSAWCRDRSDTPLTKTKLGKRLEDRGFPRTIGSGGKKFREGIALRYARGSDTGPGVTGSPHDTPHEYGYSDDIGEGTGNSPPPQNEPVTPENSCKTGDFNQGVTGCCRKTGTFEAGFSRKELSRKTSTTSNTSNSAPQDPPEPPPTDHATGPPPKRSKPPLTEEEVRRVQRLIGEGMSASWARAEVLGEEVE